MNSVSLTDDYIQEDYTKLIGKTIKIRTKTGETIEGKLSRDRRRYFSWKCYWPATLLKHHTIGIFWSFYWESKLIFIKPVAKIDDQRTEDLEVFKQEVQDEDFIVVNLEHTIHIGRTSSGQTSTRPTATADNGGSWPQDAEIESVEQMESKIESASQEWQRMMAHHLN